MFVKRQPALITLARHIVLAVFLLVASSLLTKIPAAYAEDMYALEVGGGMTATINDDKDVLRLGTYTYEFWLKDLDGPTGSWRRVFVKGAGAVNTGRGPNVGLFPSEPALQYTHSTGTGQLAVRTSEEIPVDEWIHVSLVLTALDGEQMIYLNGVQDAVGNAAGLAQDTQEPVLTIGNAAHVILDDFRIWNYARNQEEIEADMNHEVTGFEEGLVGYWRFNEGEGAIAHDLSPYENHGTIAGAIWTTEAAPIASSEPIAVATRPEPVDGALVETTWTNLTWVSGAFAVSHDLYIGTSFSDVNDGVEGTFAINTMSNTQILGFSGFPVPDGLVPGTTYYWRVDEVNDADPNSPWKGDVWSFTVPPRTAYNSEPANGMEFILPAVTLSWTGGLGANLHYVYFGDNFEDVNNAVGAPPTPDPTFTPETLELGKTYYWRVDEFDGAESHKGEVWSFSTVPNVQVTNPNLKLWWNLDEGKGTTAVDWSGHGNHGAIFGDAQWTDGYQGTALTFGQNVYVESVGYDGPTGASPRTCCAWIRSTVTGNHNIMSWGQNVAGQKWRVRTEGNVGVLRVEVNGGYHYGVTSIADGLWHHVAVTFEDDGTPDVLDTLLYVDGQLDATGLSQATAIDTAAGPVRIGESPWHNAPFQDQIDDARIYDKVLTAAEIQQVMFGDTSLAGNPVPERNAFVDMREISSLRWSAGDAAVSHDVYFGSDRDAVANATADSPEFQGNQVATSLSAAGLIEFGGGDYFWRVDEIDAGGAVNAGTIWKFTVPDYLIVEDFESYNDIEEGQPGSNLVYLTWADGFGVPTNGSTMGYAVPFEPTMETATKHGGQQSAPMAYNNVGAAVSEVTRIFTPAQDWTANGVTVLTVWFYGDPANTPGQLYAKINGIQVNYPDPAANLSLAQWQRWEIDLTTVGTNLRNVSSLAIGVQGVGATGTLLLDDIQLYLSVP